MIYHLSDHLGILVTAKELKNDAERMQTSSKKWTDDVGLLFYITGINQ
jgi:hypothetical protein